MVLLNNLAAHAAMLVARGQRAGANLALDQLEQLLADLPRTQQEWRLSLARALFAGLDGDFAEADRLSEEARVLADRPGSGYAVSAWTFQRLSLAHLRGEPVGLVKRRPGAAGHAVEVPDEDGPGDGARRLGPARRGEPAPARCDLRARGRDLEVVRRLSPVSLLEDTEVAERLYAPLAALANSHRLFLRSRAGLDLRPAPADGRRARPAGRPPHRRHPPPRRGPRRLRRRRITCS